MTALDRLRKLARLMIDSRWIDCYEPPSCGACTAALGERLLRLAMEIEKDCTCEIDSEPSMTP
jgi:hypothetical protein